jgi:hypothetical protein
MAKLSQVSLVYPTEFYQTANIPFCNKCGEKRRTSTQGVFCPNNNTDCPMVGDQNGDIQSTGKITDSVSTGNPSESPDRIGQNPG